MYRERVANTFIITNVATGVKDSLKEPQLTATILKPKLFHGCHWHGCIQCFPNPEQRTEVIRVDKNGKETTREIACLKTLASGEKIRNLGYNLVERWEREKPSPWWNDKLPPKRNETYPHTIVFDFESYQDKTKASIQRETFFMKASMCLYQFL